MVYLLMTLGALLIAGGGWVVVSQFKPTCDSSIERAEGIIFIGWLAVVSGSLLYVFGFHRL